eukprot:TRINITY_DN671_c0_g1_i3.p1 TRINITY_DN671_c0_g1~~TRINITY_DN671_c0_g1_i3.p1  ORF type:complete len:131 (-),score=4.70 TRINITY_DN671_c0_g1_i3:85-477(-)
MLSLCICQALILLVISPGELLIYEEGSLHLREEVFTFVQNYSAIGLFVLSCLLAFVVNVTFYLVVGKINAVTYQITSQGKGILVIITGILFFGDSLPLQQFIGCLITTIGLILFFYETLVRSIPKNTKND